MKKFDIAVVLPVYDDWKSFGILVREILKELREHGCTICIVAVNDSPFPASLDNDTAQNLGPGEEIRLLHLHSNLGHQRAISIGLSHLNETLSCGHVVVMDSDGEDRPSDIPRLLGAGREHSDSVIFAKRVKRSEGLLFRVFYIVYKRIFRLLTGTEISFGNFCAVPGPILARLVYVPDIWNHFAAGVLRARFPTFTVPTKRGTRLAGQGKMNFTSLISHGLRSVSVFGESMSVRLTFVSLLFLGMASLGVVVVIGIRLFTDLGIPGWATNSVLGLAMLCAQAFSLSVLLVFLVLSYRTQRSFIPARDYKDYINSVEILCQGD